MSRSPDSSSPTVANGIVYVGTSNHIPFEVDVIYSPTNRFYTGFFLSHNGITQPGSYTNTFQFFTIVDVGVRVFLVSSNDPVSLQPILAHNYAELQYPNSYVFDSGSSFFVGLYTGNVQYAPPDGIYNDPLFGWAELVNNKGVIELVDGAMAYKAGGIYAGTQDIFDVPEPGVAALLFLASLFFGWRFARRRR